MRTTRWSCRSVAVLAALFALLLTFNAGRAATPTYVTQWGGNGSGNGQFLNPWGIAVDRFGNVYVADTGNHRIQKFTSAGVYVTQWGGYGTGNGQFNGPGAAAVDADGNVYVVELTGHRLQKFTGDGTYLTQWGSQGVGAGQFFTPAGVAVDGSGNVYVTEMNGSRVQKFTSTGTYLAQWGGSGSGNGQFHAALGIAIDDSTHVFVSDQSNHRIQKFTETGAYLAQWGVSGSGEGQLRYPCGLALDAAGSLYVADMNNQRIQGFSGSGAFQTAWGGPGGGDGQFSYPYGVAADDSGYVYVADTNNHRVQKFRLPRAFTIEELYAGLPGIRGSTVTVTGWFPMSGESLLVSDLWDYLGRQPMPARSALFLDGPDPPDTTWSAARIQVEGTVDTLHLLDPCWPEDSVVIVLRGIHYVSILEPPPTPAPLAPALTGAWRLSTSVAAATDPTKFGLLISGGGNEKENRGYFWDELTRVYQTMTQKLGFAPDNVRVSYYHGTSKNEQDIPQSRVTWCHPLWLPGAFSELASKVGACTRSGNKASVRLFITNHGADNGDICLLGTNRLTAVQLAEYVQAIVDSCASEVIVDFYECYGGVPADLLKQVNDRGKTTFKVCSAAGPGVKAWAGPRDPSVYLRMKMDALANGQSEEDATRAGLEAYNSFLLLYGLWVKHELLAAVNKSVWFTSMPFKAKCESRKVTGVPGGQLVLDFTGPIGSRGDATIYEILADGSKVRRSAWVWNVPGSAGFRQGYDRRVLNVDAGSTGRFEIHDDDGAFRVVAAVRSVREYAESPSNAEEYAGFTEGSRDSSGAEFADLHGTELTVANVDQVGFNLKSLPRVIGHTSGTGQLTATYTNSGNSYWQNMALELNVNAVLSPGALSVTAPAGIPSSSVPITTPGQYVVPLGAVHGGYIRLSALDEGGPTIELDSWSLRPVESPYAVDSSRTDADLRLGVRVANPILPGTAVHFIVDAKDRVRLRVFDVRGRVVARLLDEVRAPGRYDVRWDGLGVQRDRLASGVYFVQLSVGGRTATAKAILLR